MDQQVLPAGFKALIDMQLGFIQSMVLNAAVKLKIADIIAGAGENATLSAAEIGAKLPTSSSKLSVTNLKRLLRTLVLYNVFRAEHGDGTSDISYGLTPLSELLVSNAPHSLLPRVKMVLHKAMLTPWLYLDEAVLDGAVEPFGVANDGKNLWALSKEDEELNAIFHAAMATISSGILDSIMPKYEGFKGVRVVADVGGGVGVSLKSITKHNPHINGINFDLPHVVATAPQIPGVSNIGGDMFESVPEADAIFMKGILHDWSDEQSVQILNNCWKSLPEEGGKVILLEMVIPLDDGNNLDDVVYANQVDLMMMAVTSGGKERTALEWQAILSAAGFTNTNFLKFSGGSAFAGTQYIIESFKGRRNTTQN